MCQVPGCQQHYGCRLRSKGLHVSPRATPNRRRPEPYRRGQAGAWEKGLALDERGVPILDEKLTPLNTKTYAEQRHRIDETFRKMDNPTPKEQ